MAVRAPRGRWWDDRYRDTGGITADDYAAELAVTAWETAERPGEEPREGKCPSCGRPSDDGAECIGCERGAYDASGVRP